MDFGNVNFIIPELRQSKNAWHMRIDFQDEPGRGRVAKVPSQGIVGPTGGQRKTEEATLIHRCCADDEEIWRWIGADGLVCVAVMGGRVEDIAQLALRRALVRAHERTEAD